MNVNKPNFSQFKIGFGLDAHRFLKKNNASTKPLYLAGVLIKNHIGLKAHSDGDVVLHSLIDALLGALALENICDIGDLFPDTNAQYKNCRSEVFVQKINELMAENHYSISNIDITICAQTPKLASYKTQMKVAIAEMLKINSSQVSVKATTTEKMDSVGKKKGIYCYCSVLICNKTFES